MAPKRKTTKEQIIFALQKNNHHLEETAKSLKISRITLRRNMEYFGLVISKDVKIIFEKDLTA